MGRKANLMAAGDAPAIFNRKALADRAMQASIAARLEAQCGLVEPISIFDLATRLGVRVTFNSINMEGMYQRGSPPRIHLSALRPLVRRAYNCGHELGHHVLGHGSSIDELREDQSYRPWDIPNEFSADTFAGFILMPTLGLRQAFAARECQPETASPVQLYGIACQFGVGYSSLVTHLHYGARMISRSRLNELQKSNPRRLRAEILGMSTTTPLVVLEAASTATTVDVEVKHHLLLSPDTEVMSDALGEVADLAAGRLYEARRPGIVQILRSASGCAAFVRISRTAYVGRAEFRHLEDDSDE